MAVGGAGGSAFMASMCSAVAAMTVNGGCSRMVVPWRWPGPGM